MIVVETVERGADDGPALLEDSLAVVESATLAGDREDARGGGEGIATVGKPGRRATETARGLEVGRGGRVGVGTGGVVREAEGKEGIGMEREAGTVGGSMSPVALH